MRNPVRTRLMAALALLAALLTAVPATAQTVDAPPDFISIDPNEVIAYQGTVVLKQEELDAAFTRIPQAQRLAFIRDGAKVDQLITALLKRKVVAAEAQKAGYDREPLVSARMQLAAEKELSEAWLEHVITEADDADYEALAHEDYLVHPENYRSEEVLDVSQILIGTGQRSPTDAQKLANSLERWLEQEPDRFDALVEEYSDDPTKGENGGRFPEVRRGQMVPEFEKAAFALQKEGQISAPVQTQYGYHIIRLNGRSGGEVQPYDEVRDVAVERARAQYLEAYRVRYLKEVLQEPIVIPEGAVEIMARRHFGENLELDPGAFE